MKYLDQIDKKEIDLNHLSSNDNLDILITGDFAPINSIEELCKNNNYHEIYDDFLWILKNKDLSITNLETPLTTKLNPIKKRGSNLVANPICTKGIRYGGFDIATLSNNHIYDYGELGLLDTIKACNDISIKTVGAGKNIKEARQPLYIDIKGKKIAILNFSEHEFSIAEENKAGSNPLDPFENYYQVLEAKSKSDITIVIVHGGNELYPLPSPRIIKNYHFLADLGVTAIIGHHPHCASGFEIYKGVPIFYSLGNFIFDLAGQKESWYEGYFIKLKINNNSPKKITLFPYYQCKNKTGLSLMNNEEEKQFLNKIKDYSKIIIDNDLLKENWIKFCDSKKITYLSKLLSYNVLKKQIIKKNLFSKLIINEKNLLLLLNLVRCEAHREVIIEILNSIINKKDTG